MPVTNFANTPEETQVFEKVSWALRVGVAGTFLGIGVGSVILASKDLKEAEQSNICVIQTSSECEELLSEKRDELISAGVGGVVLGGLAAVTMLISRKEQE